MRQRNIRSARSLLLLLALAAGLAGCNTASSPTPADQAQTAAQTAPAPTATLSGPVYDNPVYDRNFPDPHVLRVGDIYYAYSTADAGANIPVVRSTDLVHWESLGDSLLAVPSWSQPGHTWAPGVIQVGEQLVMFYTTRHNESNRQCISVAVSEKPEGLFVDNSTGPLICQLDLGGSIDPYPFRDENGQLYLFWKNDGNCCGKPVGLWVQPLSDDGLTLTGEPVELIQRDQAWERPLIENPAMVEHEDTYYLFYSGNRWESHEYAVGYAVCETITGPCVKPQAEPIFTFTPEVLGPGGESFFTDAEGNLWMAYHAWTDATVGYPAGQRSLHIDPVTFAEAGKPVITGPTSDPQPLP
jgi:beta-xylosidase